MERRSGSDLQSSMERVVNNTGRHMEALGYSRQYLRLCRGIWRDLAKFSLQESVDEELSMDRAARFLASRGIPVDSSHSGLTSRQRLIRAAVRILTEFHLHGCFQRRSGSSEKLNLPAAMRRALEDYQVFCAKHRRCGKTMRGRRLHITRFLHFLDSREVVALSDIRPEHLSEFVRSQIHLKAKTLALIVSNLRSFLRFLCMAGILSEDLSHHVPKVRVIKNSHIPSVWSEEAVKALLAVVDRSSPKGKRDYAILVLGCRLGLRVGDIRALRLEHIQWEKAQIEISQTKTGVPLTLPLSEEVGEALIDYLRHGRPATDYREVFLRFNAPIEPFASNNNLHNIITFYRTRAGIKLPLQARKGMHSLRHTLASRLLEVETPLETIAEVLGHLSLESTRIYAKVDINTLRTAALGLEEVSHA